MESKKEFDSLKDKLKKLKALAERGCGGEAENAQRLLNLKTFSVRQLLTEKRLNCPI